MLTVQTPPKQQHDMFVPARLADFMLLIIVVQHESDTCSYLVARCLQLHVPLLPMAQEVPSQALPGTSCVSARSRDCCRLLG